MVLVVVEVDFHGFLVDAVEQGGDLDGGVGLVVLQLEANAVGTTAQGVQSHFVGFGDIFHGDVLTNEPFVAFGFVAADVGEFIGILAGPWDVGKVFGAVVRSHLEAFGGAPNQFLVVVGTFKVFLDDSFPFLGAHRWKFLKDFFKIFHIFSELFV